MTAARLLLDKMISPAVAEQLRTRGHDVVAVAAQPHLVRLPDDQVLAVATAERRAVVTLDVADFSALDRIWTTQQRAHAGIILLATSAFPQDRAFVEALVAAVLAAVSADELPAPGEVRFLARH